MVFPHRQAPLSSAKLLLSTIIVCLCLPSSLIAQEVTSPSSAELRRADAVSLPSPALSELYGYSLAYLGVSAKSGDLAFLDIVSNDGIGGNAPMSYRFFSPESGKAGEIIKLAFNLAERGTYNQTEAQRKALEAELAALEARGKKAFAAHNVTVPLYPAWLYEFSIHLRCLNPDFVDSGENQKNFRVYLRHDPSNQLRPLADITIPAYHEEALHFIGFYPSAQGWGFIAHFRRDSIMEFDGGADIHLIASPSWSAQFLNEAGYALYAQKRYRDAIKLFAFALESDSRHERAAYNAACCAALETDILETMKYLRILKAIPGAEAQRYIAKVDTDPDFNTIRKRPEFIQGMENIRR